MRSILLILALSLCLAGCTTQSDRNAKELDRHLELITDLGLDDVGAKYSRLDLEGEIKALQDRIEVLEGMLNIFSKGTTVYWTGEDGKVYSGTIVCFIPEINEYFVNFGIYNGYGDIAAKDLFRSEGDAVRAWCEGRR